jgi:hypothetical protein
VDLGGLMQVGMCVRVCECVCYAVVL